MSGASHSFSGSALLALNDCAKIEAPSEIAGDGSITGEGAVSASLM